MSDSKSTERLRPELEKLLLKQARLTIKSDDKRSANKYEVIPDLINLIEHHTDNSLLERLESFMELATDEVFGTVDYDKVVELLVREITKLRELSKHE